jgi:hypothetical protein
MIGILKKDKNKKNKSTKIHHPGSEMTRFDQQTKSLLNHNTVESVKFSNADNYVGFFELLIHI